MAVEETPSLTAWPPFIGNEPLPDIVDGLAQSQYWPAAVVALGQQLQLMHLLEWATDKVAHYRDAAWAAKAVAELRRSPADFWDIWQTLPILTKGVLRSESAQMRALNVPKGHLPLGKTITSGSTGISVEVATTAVTHLIWNALTLREMYWSGREFNKRLGAIRYLAKADRDPQGHFAASWPKLIAQHHRTGPFGIIHVGHPVDVVAEWLQQLDPHYLITHPSVGEALLHDLGGSRKPSSLEEILFVSEPLSTALEARMAGEWGVRCAEYYSANEVGYIAIRCREQGRLHVQSESVLVEIIDASGKPCGVGETGRVVATPLHNVATPLIRYELGDYATAGQPCACGRSLPVIDRVLGRVRNLVRTPDGRRHWPVELGNFRSVSAVRQFQYVQSGPATIELRVVLNQPLTAEEADLAKAFVQEALGYPFQVEIIPVPEIARGPTGSRNSCPFFQQTRRMTNPRNDFWAITTYFNLANGSRRRNNYHCFRRHISVPLLTVEWHPDRDFQLADGDADFLLQIGGGDLMWQKERLLNLAASALPEHVKYVAWIDCDVLFENPNWADEAAEALSGNRVVQLFKEIGFPDAQESARLIASPAPELDSVSLLSSPTRPSYLSQFLRFREDVVRLGLGRRTQSAILSNADILQRPAHGFAWAAQASFLREIGLYDRCIVGSGDMHFCYGVAGLAQGFIESQREIGVAFYGDCPSYRHWASRVAASCAGRLGCVDGRILHLFHGEVRERQYIQRIDNLLPFALDLDEDICAGEGHPWSWKRDRSALNAYFLKYMRDRNEDGQHPPAAGVAANT